MHILRRDTWVPPYRVHVPGRTGSSAPCQKVRTDFFDKLKEQALLPEGLFLFTQNWKADNTQQPQLLQQ